MPSPDSAEIPRKPAPRLCTLLIIATTALWFAAMLWAKSDLSGGMFGGFATFLLSAVALLTMLLTWLVVALYTLLARRRFRVLFVPAAAIAVAIALPWSKWIFWAQFRAAEPELRAFAQAATTSPDSPVQSASVHGFEFVGVARHSGAVFLTQARSPDGEFGLVFSPSGSLPSAPDWAKHHGYTRVAPDWWKYHWSND